MKSFLLLGWLDFNSEWKAPAEIKIKTWISYVDSLCYSFCRNFTFYYLSLSSSSSSHFTLFTIVIRSSYTFLLLVFSSCFPCRIYRHSMCVLSLQKPSRYLRTNYSQDNTKTEVELELNGNVTIFKTPFYFSLNYNNFFLFQTIPPSVFQISA